MRALFLILLGISFAHGATVPALVGSSELRANGMVSAYDPSRGPQSYTVSGSGVSQLNDLTGLGRHLTNATAANQPIISRDDNAGNLVLQSQTFQTTWTRTRVNAFGATDTGATGAGSFANTARTTDPIGGNTADFVQEDATASNNHVVTQTGVLGPAGDQAFSVYVKPAGRDWVFVAFVGSTDSCSSYFDAANGTVGTAANVGAATGAAGSILAAGNGWYRCTVTGTTTLPLSSVTIRLASGNGGQSYSGDNTSGLYLWGASMRRQSWDTNYIATTTVPVFPAISGLTAIYFNGSSHYLQTAGFTLPQPASAIWVGKQMTWTANDALFDGGSADTFKLYQDTTTPALTLNSGSDGPTTTAIEINSMAVAQAILDGANSRLGINASVFPVADSGAGNPGGFTVGASPTPGAYSHQAMSELLLFNRALSPTEISVLGRMLMRKYNISDPDLSVGLFAAWQMDSVDPVELTGRFPINDARGVGIAPGDITSGYSDSVSAINFVGTNYVEAATLYGIPLPDSIEANTGLALVGTNWFIADAFTGNLVRVDTNGTFVSVVNIADPSESIQGLSLDTSDNTLWYIRFTSKEIRHITLDGVDLGDGWTVAYTPSGCAYNATDDTLWVVEYTPTQGVRKYSCVDGTLTGSVDVTKVGFQLDHIAIEPTDGSMWLSWDTSAFSDEEITNNDPATGAEISSIHCAGGVEGIVPVDTTLWYQSDAVAHKGWLRGNRLHRSFKTGVPMLGLTNAMTVSAWLNPSIIHTNNGVVAQRASGAAGAWQMVLITNVPSWRVWTSGGQFTVDSGPELQTNQWSHFCGVYNGSTLTYYINGSQAVTPAAAVGTNLWAQSDPVWMGGYFGTNNLFTGKIADVKIWSKALSAAEVAFLFSSSLYE